MRRLGGASGQGYLFARPLVAEDIEVLLARQCTPEATDIAA